MNLKCAKKQRNKWEIEKIVIPENRMKRDIYHKCDLNVKQYIFDISKRKSANSEMWF